MLQSGLAEALLGPLNTFSFEERKRPSGSSEKILHYWVFFVPVKDFFIIIIFQDIDFLWYIASSDNVLKTPA